MVPDESQQATARASLVVEEEEGLEAADLDPVVTAQEEARTVPEAEVQASA